MLQMEPTPKKKDLMVSEDVASLKKNINKTVKSNKCYQCDYAFSKASDLKRHYEILKRNIYLQGYLDQCAGGVASPDYRHIRD